MGLLQRNHQERISFGKPFSFRRSRIDERICFWGWLLNRLLRSQKSFFTIHSWRQVLPQRNVGLMARCVQSSSVTVLLTLTKTSSFPLAPTLSYPSSASASSSCSSCTSHLASPQVGIHWFFCTLDTTSRVYCVHYTCLTVACYITPLHNPVHLYLWCLLLLLFLSFAQWWDLHF